MHYQLLFAMTAKHKQTKKILVNISIIKFTQCREFVQYTHSPVLRTVLEMKTLLQIEQSTICYN